MSEVVVIEAQAVVRRFGCVEGETEFIPVNFLRSDELNVISV